MIFLRTLCETRWASRADALYTFGVAFPVIVQLLETLSQNGNGKARGYSCSIKQFDFIIALCAALCIRSMCSLHTSFSYFLPSFPFHTYAPFQHSGLVNDVVRKERRSHRGSPRSESGSKYHERWERWSVGLEGSISVEETDYSWVWHWAKHAKNNRKAATQGECPSHKPRVLLAKSCVSPSHWSMNDRLLSQEDRFLGQWLLPTKLQGLSNDVQDKMYAAYKNDLTDKGEYDNEMLPWKSGTTNNSGWNPWMHKSSSSSKR